MITMDLHKQLLNIPLINTFLFIYSVRVTGITSKESGTHRP